MQPVMVVLLGVGIGLAGATGLVTLELLSGVWAGRLVVSGACPKVAPNRAAATRLTAKYLHDSLSL